MSIFFDVVKRIFVFKIAYGVELIGSESFLEFIASAEKLSVDEDHRVCFVVVSFLKFT